MSDSINTQKRSIQYRGPVDSSDYNLRIEENYKDLVYLYNKLSTVDSKLAQSFERVIKDQAFLASVVNDLIDRISALEAAGKKISIHSFSQLDYINFVGTGFAISSNDLLSFDPYYNVITLPKVTGSSTSKLKFFNSSVGQIVPDFFKTYIQNNYTGVDIAGNIVNTTPTYNAILDDPNKVWKRNIISNESSSAGAQMMFYAKVPTEFTGSMKTNCIKFNPYPMHSVDISSIEYTTVENPTLTESDVWVPLNSSGLYNGIVGAIGKVPPGGWLTAGSDTIFNSGPLSFYFAEKEITAIRIKMVQRNYFKELDKYIYTYGLSDLDIRYDKFLPSGKTIVKFTAPEGQLIEEITDVEPFIYNVPLSQMSNSFSYRVIYDDGSGNYSLSNPGASSQVWIEITLNMLDDKTPPVLSDLLISYN
jgi:hypothetical protein